MLSSNEVRLEMNTGSNHCHDNFIELPRWVDCDFFCIHEYAGTGSLPCGWRGRLQEVRQDNKQLLCPRCGCATLLRIPLQNAEDEKE
jgi:hypothetical protein